jgi:large subunit ribosomal protein L17
MRHRKAGRTLGRTSGQRKNLYRSLVTALLLHERVQTTEAKARAIRRHAEKLITLSRRGQTERILELVRAQDQTALAQLIQARRAEKLFATDPDALEETVRAMGVNARRLAAGRLNGPAAVRKLFDELGPRYADRPGGYTRTLKLGFRKGDAAPMALIELVTE